MKGKTRMAQQPSLLRGEEGGNPWGILVERAKSPGQKLDDMRKSRSLHQTIKLIFRQFRKPESGRRHVLVKHDVACASPVLRSQKEKALPLRSPRCLASPNLR